MQAFLILEDGTVFTGTHIGADREVISEIVFNTSMAGYPEVLTDPSYAGQAVCMTYPLIGNYGVCREDMESRRPWVDGFIVRELSRTASNFRTDLTIQEFLEEYGTRHCRYRYAGADQDSPGKGYDERYDYDGCRLPAGGGASPPEGI